MSRYLVVVSAVTVIGLAIVYGEVEAMKTGYEIRQLGIQKRDLTHRVKDAEFQIASVTSPDQLEARMNQFQVKLASPRTLKLARVRTGSSEVNEHWTTRGGSLARFWIPSAQSETR